jgi:hypothetical protein
MMMIDRFAIVLTAAPTIAKKLLLPSNADVPGATHSFPFFFRYSTRGY